MYVLFFQSLYIVWFFIQRDLQKFYIIFQKKCYKVIIYFISNFSKKLIKFTKKIHTKSTKIIQQKKKRSGGIS